MSAVAVAAEPESAEQPAPDAAPLRVAYIMSRFPKLTETFILFEMAAVERQGPEILLFTLLRERESAMHPEAAPYVARATYLPFLSPAILASHGHFLRHLASRRSHGHLYPAIRPLHCRRFLVERYREWAVLRMHRCFENE